MNRKQARRVNVIVDVGRQSEGNFRLPHHMMVSDGDTPHVPALPGIHYDEG